MVRYGQELEPETYAVSLASMLLRTIEFDLGRDLSQNIKPAARYPMTEFPANDSIMVCP